jgi:ornithine racemase
MGFSKGEAKPTLMPRIEISLSQIQDNARMLSELYQKKGISLMGVSKAVLGEPAIIEAMIRGGVKFIADSRLENIQKMRAAGLATQFVLLRTPPSYAAEIVKSVDISLNTEIETLRQLSACAGIQHKIHKVIIMVELGDLREGVLPQDLAGFIQETLTLPHLQIVGIGCNLACYGGVKPDRTNMDRLSTLVDALEQEFQLDLEIISGGNSANYDWGETTPDVGNINNLRLGEAIFLGCETTNRKAIPGLHQNAFQLVAEVIESKDKPSIPSGEICQDGFGKVPIFLDRGTHQRSILALGKQDVPSSSLKSHHHLDILGSSSDHLILDSSHYPLRVGDAVKFDLDYSGLLAAMTSPFIRREFVSV